MPEYQLAYFNIYGRAEPARMMLNVAGADWEDVHKSGDSWTEFKKVCPGGQMPTLILSDGTMMGQSMSIVRFLGKKLGYYPQDAKEAYYVDAAVDTCNDHLKALMKPAFMDNGEERNKAVEEAFESAEKLAVKLEVFLKEGNFLAGANLTIADFVLGHYYCSHWTNPKFKYGHDDGKWAEFLEKHPALKAWGAKFTEAIKAHLDKRFEAAF